MKRQFIFAILAVLGFAVFGIGCQDDLARITKVVNEGAVVEQTRATALSNIIDLSRNEHPDYGVCFSESDYPTVDDDRIALGFIDSRKEFEVTLRRLRYNTEYHFRPYVYDEQDVIYGDVQSVIINSTEGIIAYHNSITTVDFTTADINSSVSGLGSLKCIDFGLCYAIDATPTIESSTASLGELLNDTTFTTTLTGLDTWANYYVRAYGMLDSTTIIYSDEWTFNLSEPQLTTGTVTVGTSQSVTVSGSIDGLGVQSVSDHGYCWSQNANPTTSDQTVSYGPAVSIGPIGKYINNLAIQTVYHVRAYAVSGGQTYYGDDVAFTIFAPAQLNTGTVSTQSSTAALAEGNIVNNNIPIIEKGHCWSTNPNPTIADFKTQLGQQNPNTNGVLNSQMNNLTTNQTYYVRAYAQDSVTVFYGDVETVNAVYFSVSTNSVQTLSNDSIEVFGSLVVDGQVNVAEYGHCWVTGTGTPTISDNRYILGPTTNSISGFSAEIGGFQGGETYTIRAYATDGSIVRYGQNQTYTHTNAVTFTNEDYSINQVGVLTATAQMVVQGNVNILEYGHCVSINPNPTIADQRTIYGPASTNQSVSSIFNTLAHRPHYVRPYASLVSGEVIYGNQSNPTFMGSWTPRPNLATSLARYRAWSFGIGNIGYIGGGQNENGYVYTTASYYSQLYTWLGGSSSPPIGDYGARGCSDGTYGYLFSGSLLAQYDPLVNSWVLISGFPGPGRNYPVICTDGESIFVGTGRGTGGNGAPNYSDFYAYNIAAQAWTQLPDVPGDPRWQATGFYVNGFVYIGGGTNWNGLTGAEVNTRWRYDIANQTWNEVAIGSSSLDIGITYLNHAYLVTGSYSNQVKRYLPDIDSWINVASVPGSVRDDATAFTVGSSLYVTTGLSSSNGTVLYDLWEYTLEE